MKYGQKYTNKKTINLKWMKERKYIYIIPLHL